MLKNRNFQVLVLMALIGIALVSAIFLSNPPALAKADLTGPSQPDLQPLKEENVPSPSYRYRLDECFDVSIRELAGCREASQANSLLPVTGEPAAPDFSDYFQRHDEKNAAGATTKLSDYFLRY